MERKRQGYIHELIQTEERYMDDLQLVVEVRLLWTVSGRRWRGPPTLPLAWKQWEPSCLGLQGWV